MVKQFYPPKEIALFIEIFLKYENMKITFLIIFILFTINIYSQDPRKDAKTPNYNYVVAYDMYESSDDMREYWDCFLLNIY